MSNLEKHQKELVKNSLTTFLEIEISHGDCLISGIDEIVLNYMTGVLEELGIDHRNYQEQFDVEEFTEIMGAYFPGFANIQSSNVCDWLFKLANQLAHIRNGVTEETHPFKRVTNGHVNLVVDTEMCETSCNFNGSQCSSSSSPVSPFPPSQSSSLSSSPGTKMSKTVDYFNDHTTKSSSKMCRKTSQNSERQHKSSLSDKDDCDEVDFKERLGFDIDKEVELLQEMFPNVSLFELTHCVSIVDGDTEKAAQLIMHRLENKEAYLSTPLQLASGKSRQNQQKNDKELKAHILSRYAFVDKAEDEREHKPPPPKTEPKKLIRYRNNKIVSIKGEKYTEQNGEGN
ncbi:hypothetical protein CHUAL_002758 [Chamberlinius hualienensis]